MSDVAAEQDTLAELISKFWEHHAIDLHVSMPARVESYDATTQTVDVLPQLNRAVPDGAGNYDYEKLPKLSGIPVVWQRCGKFSVTFPLEAGDFVLLVFSERSLAAWRATGVQCDPGDLLMHGLDGAMAIPGIFPDAKPAAAADATKMRVGSETDGNGRIEFTASEVRLGQGATKGVARQGDQITIDKAALQTILDIRYSTNPGPPPLVADVTGSITSSSAHAKAVD